MKIYPKVRVYQTTRRRIPRNTVTLIYYILVLAVEACNIYDVSAE
jgi:hypothetical protein